MRRLRLAILFGGRSVEHDVSLVSARSVLAALDPERYEVVPIGVTREGAWLTSARADRFLDEGVSSAVGQPTALLADPSMSGLVQVDLTSAMGGSVVRTDSGSAKIDVVFPLIHGVNGEDGKLQGLLEMAGVPYVGSGVLGSAVGMDKEVAKRLLKAAGIPVVDSVLVRAHEWRAPDAQGGLVRSIGAEIGYPCFVKPAGQGSSVGVFRVGTREELARAVDEALAFDEKVLVERAIDAREVEVAILGNDRPEASIAGEIVTEHEFYDYEAKYHDDSTRLLVPAPISEALSDRLRQLAVEAFRALELSGMARVDFLVDRTTEEPYLNEVNTIPGFTPVSMYPRLWQATGVSYPDLVDRLVELALERHEARTRLKTSRPGPAGDPRSPAEDPAPSSAPHSSRRRSDA